MDVGDFDVPDDNTIEVNEETPLLPDHPETSEWIGMDDMRRRTTTSHDGMAETSFIEGLPDGSHPQIITAAKQEVADAFPNVDWARLDARWEKSKGAGATLQVKHSGRNRWYNIFRRDGKLASKLPKEISEGLGPTTEEISRQIERVDRDIDEANESIRENSKIARDEQQSLENRKRAEEKIARDEQRRDELMQERAELELGERNQTLRSKLRAIFKKYGFTVAAVVLAVGATVGAVVSALSKALARVAKGVGNGLKEIGKKLSSLLPGLLGSIASFVFRAAGEAVKFLGENAWLLIVAVAAYVVNQRRR